MDRARFAVTADTEPDTYEAPEHGWVCFHCGEHFPSTLAGMRLAKEHFGDYVDALPGCRLRMRWGERSLLRRIRWLERKLRELHARVVCEDTDKDRQMATMSSDHYRALRREEEKGYARGLRDARKTDSGQKPKILPVGKTDKTG